MRKIVRVITNRNNHLIALCDDGTLWIRDPYYRVYEQGWRQIKPIPDDPNENL